MRALRSLVFAALVASSDAGFHFGAPGPRPKTYGTTNLATSPAPRGPQFRLPSLPLALPALSYTSLAATTAGTLYLLQPLAWSGVALVSWCVGMPIVAILTQLAVNGGSGIARSMGGTATKDARLLQIARNAAAAVGVPTPNVFEIKAREPNAFATSSLLARDPTVAVTTGLREVLNEEELGAVLAHEMGHLRHRDVLRNMHVATAAAGLGGIYEVGRMLLDSGSSSSSKKRRGKDDEKDSTGSLGLMLMAGGLATQGVAHGLRLVASRDAELKADRAAAEAYGAEAMISALKKIDAAAARRPSDLRSHKTASQFSFAMISAGPAPQAAQPAHAGARRDQGLFYAAGRFFARVGEALRTHPTLDKRVESLERDAASGRVPQRRLGASSWGWML